jgi:hypothetical protein
MSARLPDETEAQHTARMEDERLHNALVAFTQAIGEALAVCSYGLTIGQDYVPFEPDDEDDCDEDEEEDAVTCTQAWVRVDGASPTGGMSLIDGSECGTILRLELEVGILRCIYVEEGGEAPKAADVLAASIQSMSDMTAIYRTAMGPEAPEVWDSITAGQWTPSGPLGGQYGGIWTFTVEI